MKRFIICIIVNTIILALITYFYRPVNTVDMVIGVVLAGINALIFAFNPSSLDEEQIMFHFI